MILLILSGAYNQKNKYMENMETNELSLTSNISNEEQNILKDEMSKPHVVLNPTKEIGLVLMNQSNYWGRLIVWDI